MKNKQVDNTLLSNKRVGIALGSGSARGLAHIGVIHALQEAGIKVDYVSGTSFGALIGSVFASNKLDAIEKAYREFDWKKTAYLFDIVFPKSGLIDGDKVEEFVRQYLTAQTIENLPLPFKAVAADLISGEEVVLDKGDVIKAVRASISVPGIFTPVRRENRILVDGGLVNPVPTSTVRDMGAEFVISVDLNHDIVAGKAPKKDLKQEQSASRKTNSTKQDAIDEDDFLAVIGGKYQAAVERITQSLQSLDNPAIKQVRNWLNEEPLPNIVEVMLASINIMETQITRTRLRIDTPDLLIQPRLGSIRFMEFHRADEIIDIGYQEAKKQIDKYLLKPSIENQ